MKTIKFFSVMILSFIMTSIFAQQQGQGQKQQGTPEARAKTQVEWMAKDLSLDQATQTKVNDVLVKFSKKTSEERKKLTTAGTDKAEIKTKLQLINAEQNKELKAVLGDQKFELYQKKLAERKAAPPKKNN